MKIVTKYGFVRSRWEGSFSLAATLTGSQGGFHPFGIDVYEGEEVLRIFYGRSVSLLWGISVAITPQRIKAIGIVLG